MKHSLYIAARNFVRLLPVTVISVLFTAVSTKSNYWCANMAIFFGFYWFLSSAIDIRNRNLLIKERDRINSKAKGDK